MKKIKIDTSKKRRIELSEIIKINRELYNICRNKSSAIDNRRYQEIERLKLKLLNILYQDLDLDITTRDIYRPMFVVDNKRYDLLDIDIYSSSIYIKYDNSRYDSSDVELKRLEFLQIIFSRIDKVREDYLTSIFNINQRYSKLGKMIKLYEYESKLKTANLELNKINDHLKLQPGNIFLFDSAQFRIKKTKSTRYNSNSIIIDSLEIKNVTSAYCDIICNRGNETMLRRIKHEFILTLLNENKYTYPPHILRQKKLENILNDE
jgi:hypothetical protein